MKFIINKDKKTNQIGSSMNSNKNIKKKNTSVNKSTYKSGKNVKKGQ